MYVSRYKACITIKSRVEEMQRQKTLHIAKINTKQEAEADISGCTNYSPATTYKNTLLRHRQTIE